MALGRPRKQRRVPLGSANFLPSERTAGEREAIGVNRVGIVHARILWGADAALSPTRDARRVAGAECEGVDNFSYLELYSCYVGTTSG